MAQKKRPPIVFVVALALIALTGCQWMIGPEGPEGPEGPAGPGASRFTHVITSAEVYWWDDMGLWVHEILDDRIQGNSYSYTIEIRSPGSEYWWDLSTYGIPGVDELFAIGVDQGVCYFLCESALVDYTLRFTAIPLT